MMHNVRDVNADIVPSGDVDPQSIGLFVQSLGGVLQEIAVTLAPQQALVYCFTVDERPLRVCVPLSKDVPVQSLAPIFPAAGRLERRLAAQDATLVFV